MKVIITGTTGYVGRVVDVSDIHYHSPSDGGRDWDRSVFDSDRFRNNGSGNWVDWEDVSIGKYDGDGFGLYLFVQFWQQTHFIAEVVLYLWR